MANKWQDIREGLCGALVIGGSLVTPFLRYWRTRWGATEAELKKNLPGDDLVPHPKWQYTNAITINAPLTSVWPWLVQVGQGRGGWYSYEWLENLAGCDIHNANQIIPEFQHLKVGDIVELAPQFGYPVAIVDPCRAIVLHSDSRTGGLPIPVKMKPGDYNISTWGFFLEEINEKCTRLITRLRNDYTPKMVLKLMAGHSLVEPVSTAMQRKMLKGIKKRAEA